jgi:hypothetical protein
VLRQAARLNLGCAWIPPIPLGIARRSASSRAASGDDTNVNTPSFVLTAGSASADQLTTHKLDLVDGTFNPAQIWQLLTGVLGS